MVQSYRLSFSHRPYLSWDCPEDRLLLLPVQQEYYPELATLILEVSRSLVVLLVSSNPFSSSFLSPFFFSFLAIAKLWLRLTAYPCANYASLMCHQCGFKVYGVYVKSTHMDPENLSAPVKASDLDLFLVDETGSIELIVWDGQMLARGCVSLALGRKQRSCLDSMG
jgi:hypothetical protein